MPHIWVRLAEPVHIVIELHAHLLSAPWIVEFLFAVPCHDLVALGDEARSEELSKVAETNQANDDLLVFGHRLL